MVEYLEAGGQQRPFAATFRARAHFEAYQVDQTKKLKELHPDKEDFTTEELVELGTDSTIKMAYEGFKYGAIKSGQNMDFNKEDVEAWLDAKPSLANEVVETWEATNAKPVEATPEKKEKAQK